MKLAAKLAVKLPVFAWVQKATLGTKGGKKKGVSLHVVTMMKACTQKQLGADEAGSQASSDADNANGIEATGETLEALPCPAFCARMM